MSLSQPPFYTSLIMKVYEYNKKTRNQELFHSEGHKADGKVDIFSAQRSINCPVHRAHGAFENKNTVGRKIRPKYLYTRT